jgi:hypothetical protein
MAEINPQNSRHQSRILREMSRDLNRSIHSVASSTGSNHGTVSTDSTMTEFDPMRDGAIMSTIQINQDVSQKLPELRNTAKKYGRWAPRQEQDNVINTSALGRAFPDFSQGGSSDDDMSVEVARGPMARQRPRTRVASRPEYSDSIESSHLISNTPKKASNSVLQEALRNSAAKKDSVPKRNTASHKENVPPLSTQNTRSPSHSPYISHASRNIGGERRTLAELHAKIADDLDSSFLGEERPATVTFKNTSTRFSSNKPYPPAASISSKKELNEPAAQKLRTASGTPSKVHAKQRTNQITNSNTPNPTQQSFLLPNMPEISDIMSGPFDTGVPVSTHGGRVVSRSQHGASRSIPHEEVDGIPIPDEENDIYLNIDILKEKVKLLETEKVEYQRNILNLQSDNYQLQAEKKELEERRSADSALGMADSGSDADESSPKARIYDTFLREIPTNSSRTYLLTHTQELREHVLSLQRLLTASDRKAESQELRLRNSVLERDQAVVQLAEALDQNKALQAVNHGLTEAKKDLQQENDALRTHITAFMAEADGTTRSMEQEKYDLTRQIQTLKGSTEQNAKNLEKERHELTKKMEALGLTGEENARKLENERQQLENQINALKLKNEEDIRASLKKESMLLSKIQRRDRAVKEMQEATQEIRETTREIRATSTNKKGLASRRPSKGKRASSIPLEQFAAKSNNISGQNAVDEQSFDVYSTTSATFHKNIHDNTAEVNQSIHSDQGSEFASILGEGYMQNLRQIRKEVRIEKRHLAAQDSVTEQDDTVQTANTTRSRVQSINGITDIHAERDDTVQSALSTRLRAQSVNGLTGILKNKGARTKNAKGSTGIPRNRKSRDDTDDMTSAYIIPDISFVSDMKETVHPTLSASARRVLDKLCNQDCLNCSVCTQVASYGTKDTREQNATMQNARVSKPVPVSDRMPVAAPYEDEPTLRPLVKPGLALAIVIKGLEDEVVHLKMEQAQVNALYTKHDPSLSLRKRHALKNRLSKLTVAIETKSDQIYALYDVLEGQKQSGQEMTEEDFENTLLSIGIDPESKDDGEDTDLDLPWEGIEDTVENN